MLGRREDGGGGQEGRRQGGAGLTGVKKLFQRPISIGVSARVNKSTLDLNFEAVHLRKVQGKWRLDRRETAPATLPAPSSCCSIVPL